MGIEPRPRDQEADELAIARAVLAAVRTVPGVAGVSPGRFAAAGTYGPREVVRGVAVRRSAGALDLEVRVVAAYAPSAVLPELAARVRGAARRAVEALGAGPIRSIDVAIDGLRTPAETQAEGRSLPEGRP